MEITQNERRAATDRLRAHWATEAADAGLRSLHGSLVEMARSGVQMSGRASYEGVVTDERFGHRGRVEEHRLVGRAVQSIEPLEGLDSGFLRAVLWAALAPVRRPWHPQVRAALIADVPEQKVNGVVMPRLRGLSDDELGAALLTERVQWGLANGEYMDSDRTSGIRVWSPSNRDLNNHHEVRAAIIWEARALLAFAVDALVLAMRRTDPGFALVVEQQTRRRRPRTVVYREGVAIEACDA